ncbi:hypothetical protein KK062_24970 [Fulvivirgaceae bacterium PWU5]|uniref:Uncharacterized protein n=1 Tax=Dawidia cretensis TaxID=2782350 RepID=A0AAP2E3N9_9BACT|nr:hypothetical protein [Dawidia cretensis]
MNYYVNADQKVEVGTFGIAEIPVQARKLTGIKARMSHISCVHKAVMISSFARRHQIQASLVHLNPDVAKIISSTDACHQLQTVYAAYKEQTEFVSSLDQ